MSLRFVPDYRARLLALPGLVRQGGGAEDGAAGQRRGGRLEFREHRPYVAGDDPRDLDWNLYLRLGQLVTKEYERDEAPEVTIILDRSASMGGAGKDRAAREIGGGLAYAALAARCPVLVMIPAEGGPVTVGSYRSTRKVDSLLAMLEGLGQPDGGTHLDALRHLKPAAGTGRVAFLVSDFLVDPLPARAAVALARGAGTGAFLHLVTEKERAPALPAACTLVDPESGERLFAPDTGRLLQTYASELASHEEAVAGLALRHGLDAQVVSDDAPFERCVLTALRRGEIR